MQLYNQTYYWLLSQFKATHCSYRYHQASYLHGLHDIPRLTVPGLSVPELSLSGPTLPGPSVPGSP